MYTDVYMYICMHAYMLFFAYVYENKSMNVDVDIHENKYMRM